MKDKRIELRANYEQRQAIRRAADLEGVSVSDFIRLAATEKAHKVIEQYHVIRVTLENGEKMMEALDQNCD